MTFVACLVCPTLAPYDRHSKKHFVCASLVPLPRRACWARVSHEEDSNAYVWSYAKRAIGTHVLRQKHWPGNAMMHPPDPNTFATSVAIRSVPIVSLLLLLLSAPMSSLLCASLYFLGMVASATRCDDGPKPTLKSLSPYVSRFPRWSSARSSRTAPCEFTRSRFTSSHSPKTVALSLPPAFLLEP